VAKRQQPGHHQHDPGECQQREHQQVEDGVMRQGAQRRDLSDPAPIRQRPQQPGRQAQKWAGAGRSAPHRCGSRGRVNKGLVTIRLFSSSAVTCPGERRCSSMPISIAARPLCRS
jgi:hypothetical protein